ncbi:hypothetical protein RGU12_07845 [Fredinandcohnia sp. QZ13]|uniref:hypothetical protein n=1 Tax=Fredinandcohnia sp. QZ13 TaxID=3073144 RepID=UPI0028534D50|nr:hypothetical protein [Fredinandcohnia sp. QZ13]MDR4887472.1 hypothetical protein [Fredinandcohnia sp. QZ13]
MYKKLSFILFLIGLLSIVVGMPYLLGYSTNKLLAYPLYIGLIVAVVFAPKINMKNVFKNIKK